VANSLLGVPVARVSSAAISSASRRQPIACQEASSRICTSPVGRGPIPADGRRSLARSVTADLASLMTR
jgi:hypothetical protein